MRLIMLMERFGYFLSESKKLKLVYRSFYFASNFFLLSVLFDLWHPTVAHHRW